MAALNDRFANHTMGFFKQYGIGMMGFWTDEIGISNQLTYIVTFDSMADREKKWAPFAADPKRLQVFAETETEGPLGALIENTFMRLTPYSPEPQLSSKIQELRVYDAMPGGCPPSTTGSQTIPWVFSRSTVFRISLIGPKTWVPNNRLSTCWGTKAWATGKRAGPLSRRTLLGRRLGPTRRRTGQSFGRAVTESFG